jgi:lauroyl/myristoyl acyltransferase
VPFLESDSAQESADKRPQMRRKRMRRALRAKVLGSCAAMVGTLPPELAARLMRAPAFLASKGSAGDIARDNLELAFGHSWSREQLRQCHSGVFQQAARLASEVSFLSRANAARRNAWLLSNVHVHESIRHLHTALEEGHGAILATAHLGNWELIGPSMIQLGLDGAVVGRFRERDPSADWIVRMRERVGVTTFPQDSNPKELLRLLKKGQVLGLVCDLEVKRMAGEFLPFFGRSALTMTAPAALTRASKAPIVPVRCVRTPGNPDQYTLTFEPPLAWDDTLSKPEARTRILTDLNSIFERWIRATPEQWAWYQPRWRTRPGTHESVPLRERNRRNRT